MEEIDSRRMQILSLQSGMKIIFYLLFLAQNDITRIENSELDEFNKDLKIHLEQKRRTENRIEDVWKQYFILINRYLLKLRY